jgi:hypothetical protein
LEPDGLAQAISRAIAERDLLRGNVVLLTRSLRWENEAKRLRRLIDTIVTPAAAPQLAPLATVP